MCEPMNPAPPVIRYVLLLIRLCVLHLSLFCRKRAHFPFLGKRRDKWSQKVLVSLYQGATNWGHRFIGLLDWVGAVLWLGVVLSACTPPFQTQGDQRALSNLVRTSSSCNGSTCTSSPDLRPVVDTWENIHLFQSFDYHIKDPASIAKYYNFVWGVTPNNLATFRAANPRLLLSYYIPFHRDGGTFDDQNLAKKHDVAYWKALHPDWILYRCDRKTPAFEYNDENVPFDFANPALIAWQVQNYAQPASAQGYDAIAADNLNVENLFGACGFYKNGQWVQRYTGRVDDAQWRADIVNWVVRMQAALHALSHPLALIPNLGLPSDSDPATDRTVQQVVSHVDAVLDEAGFTKYGTNYLTGDNWVQTVQFIKMVQQQGKPYYIVNEFKTPAIGADQIQWALASYLMCKEHLASVFISRVQDYGIDWRYPAYNASIGSPQDDMYLAQGAYWRDYSGGLVVVNPNGARAVTVTTEGKNYVDVTGHHVNQTFTLPPHSGLLLLTS